MDTFCRECNRSSRSELAVRGEGSDGSCYRCGTKLVTWVPGDQIELDAQLRRQVESAAPSLRGRLAEHDRLSGALQGMPILAELHEMLGSFKISGDSPTERRRAAYLFSTWFSLPKDQRVAWSIIDSECHYEGIIYDGDKFVDDENGVSRKLDEKVLNWLARGVQQSDDDQYRNGGHILELFGQEAVDQMIDLRNRAYVALLMADETFKGMPDKNGISQWDIETHLREIINEHLHPTDWQAFARGQADADTDEEACRARAHAWARRQETTLERIIASPSVGRPAKGSDAALRPALYRHLHEEGFSDMLIGSVLGVGRSKINSARRRQGKGDSRV